MELVSVIIPVYNREKLVVEAIESVLNQDYENIEIVVVDDGSTDDTFEAVDNLRKKKPQIKLISQENMGPLRARIAGVEASIGEYIVFLDSDDKISRSFISGLVNTQKCTSSEVVLSRRFQEMGPLRLLYNTYPEKMDLSKDKHFLPTIWCGMNCKLYRRDSIDIRDFGFRANEDLAFSYYDLAQKRIVGCNNSSIYIQRFAPDSVAKNFIYGNLDHIDNTLAPLEKELELFESGNILEAFHSEVEAIFIKNIMERIVNIQTSSATPQKKKELMEILISYLNYRFPSWRMNEYYRRGFKGFSADSRLYVNLARVFARKIDTSSTLDYDTARREFENSVKQI